MAIKKNQQRLPVMALRDEVVFPHVIMPLFVGRNKSIKALEAAYRAPEHKILLCIQRDPAKDHYVSDDLYFVGTVAVVTQLIKLPDGTVKVLVEGVSRGKVTQFFDEDHIEALVTTETEAIDLATLEPYVNVVINKFKEYVKLNPKISSEVLASFRDSKDPEHIADTIAARLPLDLSQKKKLLEALDVKTRLPLLMEVLVYEIEKLKLEMHVEGRIKTQMEKNQREYYLKEKMNAIQKELGAEGGDLEKLDAKIKSSGMPPEAREKADLELNKLKLMSPMSAEASVSRSYLETLVGLPWKKTTSLKQNLLEAEDVLNHDHFGLSKVKERILEFLAVQQRVKKLKGPILCLVGPPGVGKTSLGESIARATGREFIRVSLGGVRDEAEIRGHRRTYIGALPGKILQKIAKVGVRNPLFLLDEIDKMSMDFRGDPASALLEVLDPEQNGTFNDHYLEVDFDLSDVMFVATANTLSTMPTALVDRLEVIQLSGYTEDEKINIARQYLIPKQKKLNGLLEDEIDILDATVQDLIRYYTREAGVRNLEREIAKLCRKVVRRVLDKKQSVDKKITPINLEDYLGVKKFHYGIADIHDQVGQVTGLAWTEVGGELLKIEGSVVSGKGKAICTGSLGEVMQESITAAITVARMRQKSLGLEKDYFDKHDIHIHVPEGATPKDGPSAGVGMCTVLISILTNKPVRADYAMTGEITLRGEVLPIGGLKEKLLAALRGGIKHVIIPKENEKDLKEIPTNVTKDLKIIPVQWVDEVLDLVLVNPLPSKKIVVKKRKSTSVKKVLKKRAR